MKGKFTKKDVINSKNTVITGKWSVSIDDLAVSPTKIMKNYWYQVKCSSVRLGTHPITKIG